MTSSNDTFCKSSAASVELQDFKFLNTTSTSHAVQFCDFCLQKFHQYLKSVLYCFAVLPVIEETMISIAPFSSLLFSNARLIRPLLPG